MNATPRALLAVLLALAAAGCAGPLKAEDDSDPAIKARVVSAIHGRKDLDIRLVAVDVNGGTVTIPGIVPTPEQIRIIDKIAKSTSGVDMVMNNLVYQE